MQTESGQQCHDKEQKSLLVANVSQLPTKQVDEITNWAGSGKHFRHAMIWVAVQPPSCMLSWAYWSLHWLHCSQIFHCQRQLPGLCFLEIGLRKAWVWGRGCQETSQTCTWPRKIEQALERQARKKWKSSAMRAMAWERRTVTLGIGYLLALGRICSTFCLAFSFSFSCLDTLVDPFGRLAECRKSESFCFSTR